MYLALLLLAETDETGLPDDIAACEEDDDEDEAAAGDGGDDMDMFGDEDADEQQQARQKRVGGRKVPKGISAAVAAMMEGHGGYAVTKFNMNQEREEGNIDEEVRRIGPCSGQSSPADLCVRCACQCVV